MGGNVDDKLRLPTLPEEDQDLFNQLWRQLRDKRRRNALRAGYYDGKNVMRHLGFTLPPQFARVAAVLGWPAKAVDTLNNRCHLEGFVMPGDDGDELGIADIWEDNHLALEAPQAGLSSLIHAVSFLITTKGGDGEPAALISPKDALAGTGNWNRREHRLDAFLSVLEVNSDGRPLGLALYLADRIITIERDSPTTAWSVNIQEHDIGYVPVEPLVFKPRLGRPFGMSRISRPVMAMTDMAMRTVLRSEVTAELYSVPQRIVLGSDDSLFYNPDGSPREAWQLVYGKMIGLPRDEEGNVPSVEQTTQVAQTPHMEQLRTLAQLFAGETSIPVTELGITSDSNPASAEAVYAHQGSLIATAEATTDGWEPAWRRAMITALKIANEVDDIPAEWNRIRARFRNPAVESRAAASDAAMKLIAALPWVAQSDIALDLFGLDPIVVERLKADKQRLEARATATALAALANRQPGGATDADT